MADEQAKREELIRQIASLPTGSLTKKTVKDASIGIFA